MIPRHLTLLASFKATPQMWAYTREAFLVHVEYAVGGLITDPQLRLLRRFAMEGQGNSVPIEKLTAPVTDEWAASVVDKTLQLIGQDPTTNSTQEASP